MFFGMFINKVDFTTSVRSATFTTITKYSYFTNEQKTQCDMLGSRVAIILCKSCHHGEVGTWVIFNPTNHSKAKLLGLSNYVHLNEALNPLKYLNTFDKYMNGSFSKLKYIEKPKS